jgi:LuxR family maltose regulon positive regulatory protein
MSLPTKLLPPSSGRVWPRVRVFERLDEAFSACDMLWISASPGAGKSALIASYLQARGLNALWYRVDADDHDPAIIFRNLSLAAKLNFPDAGILLPQFTAESQADPGAYARYYFEIFFQGLKPGTVLVFDDVNPPAMLCELALAAMCRLPAGMKVIIISRDSPPANYARLYANGFLSVLEASLLNLTLDEAVALAGTRTHGISFGMIADAHDLSAGWVTGFLLLLDGLDGLSSRQAALPNEQLLFDYLDCEVFERLDGEEQNCLLKTAILQEVTHKAVEAMTGFTVAILEKFYRRYGSFIQATASQGYIFSPAFRRYLLAKGRNFFTPDERHELVRKASDCLAHIGKVDEAIELILEDCHWQALDALVSREAPLRLMQGGHAEVLCWLGRVPDNALEMEPGLCYWKGMCRMHSDFVESRRWLERSHELYGERQDIVGKLLSWSGIVETIFLEWGDFSSLRKWIVVGEQLLEECGELPKGEIEYRVVGAMFNALMQGQPDHPQIALWADRLFGLLRQMENDNLRLLTGTPLFVYYSKWLGEHARAEVVFDMLFRPQSDYQDSTRWRASCSRWLNAFITGIVMPLRTPFARPATGWKWLNAPVFTP